MDSLLDDAFELLNLATKLEDEDDETTRIEASTKYYEAIYLMKRYVQRLPMTNDNIQTRKLIEEKISHYEKRASTLLNEGSSSATHQPDQPKSPFSKHCQFFDDTSVIPLAPPKLSSPRFDDACMKPSEMSNITEKAAQANARLTHALDLDESGQKQEAISEYMAASELYLEAIKMAENAGSGAQSVASLLKRRLTGALDRAEQLKHPQPSQRAILHESKVKDQKRQEASSSLTEAEIAVLKRSSLMASGVFLPWSDADAQKLSEEAQRTSISLWTDPDGYLKLSDKQRARFHKWARPSEIAFMRRKAGSTSSLVKPVMVKAITPYTIRQKYVTDCSFIASLCICAAFERRFDRKLVTSLIHPQTPDGTPTCSPSGKYAVKLWLNGVARQVIVDDCLPVDRFGNLLCSHTTAKGLELWVSIIEKAYMKLCKFKDLSNMVCCPISYLCATVRFF
jgi:calpain-7